MEFFKLETISVYGFCLYRVQMLCYDPGIPRELSWDRDVPLLGFMLFLVAHLEKTAPNIIDNIDVMTYALSIQQTKSKIPFPQKKHITSPTISPYLL